MPLALMLPMWRWVRWGAVEVEVEVEFILGVGVRGYFKEEMAKGCVLGVGGLLTGDGGSSLGWVRLRDRLIC